LLSERGIDGQPISSRPLFNIQNPNSELEEILELYKSEVMGNLHTILECVEPLIDGAESAVAGSGAATSSSSSSVSSFSHAHAQRPARPPHGGAHCSRPEVGSWTHSQCFPARNQHTHAPRATQVSAQTIHFIVPERIEPFSGVGELAFPTLDREARLNGYVRVTSEGETQFFNIEDPRILESLDFKVRA
jgi:hypothetical protein